MNGVTLTGKTDGPAVLLLHGGVINRHMWKPVTDRLEDRFRLISIDLPGHGDLQDKPFSIESAVERAVDVMDSLGVSGAVLVGLSMGGYVAQGVAATHPDRVSGLVLSGATIRYMGWDGWSTRLYGMVFPVVARPAHKAFVKQMAKLGPDIANPIIEGGLSMKGGGQALRRLPGRDYAAEMAGFSGPVTIANGERDEGNREHELYFREHHPDARFVVIEDAGHACALQQPVDFADVVAQLMTEVS